jgi:hypothetical protein
MPDRYKLTTGLDVRIGADLPDGTIPTRRIGEIDDVVSLADVPEWGAAIPQWLIDDGLLVPVEEESPAKPKRTKKSE